MAAQRAQSAAELGDTRHLALGHGGRAEAEPECDADGDGAPEPGAGEARQEVSMARGIRAQCLADGHPPADIALTIHGRCEPTFGTTLIRAATHDRPSTTPKLAAASPARTENPM